MWTFERFPANYPVFERFTVRLNVFPGSRDFSAGRGFVERFSADGPAFERFAVRLNVFPHLKGFFGRPKAGLNDFPHPVIFLNDFPGT